MQTRVKKDSSPMQSAVQWALLGLVIERPSYGYELVKRFEDVPRDAERVIFFPRAAGGAPPADH